MDELHRRVARPDYDRWLAHIRPAAGCTRPVRLHGQLHTVEPATGRILSTRQHRGHARRRASTSRAATAAPPSARPAPRPTAPTPTSSSAPASSAAKASPPPSPATPPCSSPSPPPASAPSTPAHRPRRTGRPALPTPPRPPSRCPHGVRPALHRAPRRRTTRRSGTPLCLDCYDHDHQVVWNALRRRTVAPHHDHRSTALLRDLADAPRRHGCGCPTARSPSCNAAASCTSTPSSASTASTRRPRRGRRRRRPASPPRHLAEADRHARPPRHPVHHRPAPRAPARLAHRLGRPARHPTASGVAERPARSPTGAVAGYLAKYATKSTEATGHTSRRLTADTVDLYADPDTHPGRLIDACWRLGTPPADLDRARPRGLGRRLRPAAPLGAHARLRRPLPHQEPPLLHHPRRAARRPAATWRRTQQHDRPDQADRDRDRDDDRDHVVVGALAFAGIGWHTTGDALLANTAAAIAREQRRPSPAKS